MAAMTEARQQAVTGVVPPQVGEAIIRSAWPSVAATSGLATVGRMLTSTYILAPLAWLLMAPLYFLKVLPFLGRKYVVTNRRVMILAGASTRVKHEIPLADIDDVRVRRDANSDFFGAATLELVSKDRVALELPGVKGAEALRHAILNASKAWVPGRALQDPFLSASQSKPA